jgi:sensor histidine kinase YesM
MKVENSKGSASQTDAHAIANGIGLNNVRRRLDLLYSGHYSLSVSDQPNLYAVALTLDLHFQPNTL